MIRVLLDAGGSDLTAAPAPLIADRRIRPGSETVR